jgi:aspartyl-tRNA(Asn)/glutamyl-tRNA(Gln) amidotransferase subunit A
MKEIVKMSVCRLADALEKKEVSAKEAAGAYLEQIKETDGQIGAYLTVTAEDALRRAGEIDSLRAAGQAPGPLAGIPMGIKDNMCTKGVKTTCASKILENFVPPYDATVIEKLAESGAVMLGKLNMDEFAMGSSTENSHYQTYGCVSRYGLVAFASSLDQIGPLTKDVADSARVLDVIAGHDAKDATSVGRNYESFGAQIGRDVREMRIALPREFLAEGIDPEVKACILRAAALYESLGARVTEVSMPALNNALPAYYVISSAEASSNLARFDGVRYGYRAPDTSDINELYKATRTAGFGSEVKRRIMLGTFALSSGYYDAYYKKALQVRTLIAREYERVFSDCDIILSPVAPTTAYKIGEKTASPMEMYLGDIYTVPINIAGVPALSIPCGADEKGLPVGMQLVGKPFSEQTLYRAGYAFEQVFSAQAKQAVSKEAAQ